MVKTKSDKTQTYSVSNKDRALDASREMGAIYTVRVLHELEQELVNSFLEGFLEAVSRPKNSG